MFIRFTFYCTLLCTGFCAVAFAYAIAVGDNDLTKRSFVGAIIWGLSAWFMRSEIKRKNEKPDRLRAETGREGEPNKPAEVTPDGAPRL